MRGGRGHVLTLCHDRDGGTCGGVSSRGGRRRVVRLCVAKRSRRPIGTLCRDMSRWKFPLYGAKRSRRRAGDRKPRGRRDRSAFAKSSGVWQKCQVSSLICQLCQNAKLKCKTIGYLNLSFLANKSNANLIFKTVEGCAFRLCIY